MRVWKIGNENVEHWQKLIPYSARVSFGRLREEESPFRFEKILWWQVSEGCVAVGEEDEAGGVEPDSVRGE